MNAYDLAVVDLGTAEITGPKHNAKILQYFKDAGHAGISDDETAWCAAFMGAMLERSGVRSTRALNAQSYLKWGEPVDIAVAKPGDVVVFKRGNSTWQGHVAFYVSHTPAKIRVLGGNQSNQVGIADYAMKDLLDVRRAPAPQRPATAPKPIPVTLPAKPVNAPLVSLVALAIAALLAAWHLFTKFGTMP